MPEIRIRFDVQPFPKERPRATKQGRMYTPRKTVAYEKELRDLFTQQFPEHTPISEPLEVKVELATDHIVIEADIAPHKPKGMRGDLDNYVKAALDALNGVAWEDDRQIVALTARKVES